MGKGHAPSRSRHLLAAADQPRGRPVPVLMEEARSLRDPSWVATTLARLAARPDAPPRDAVRAWEDVRLLLSEVDRPSRLVEVLDDVLRVAPDSHRAPLQAEALRLVEAMPDGEWTQAAVAACAPRVDAAGRQTLLRRALRNRGFEAEGCKTVVRAAPPAETARLRAVLEKLADPALRARLLGHLAQQVADDSSEQAHDAAGTAAQAAWSITDPVRRTEALRVLAWQAADSATIDRLLEASEGHPAADVARFLTTLGARADRLGDEDRARSILLRAVAITGRIPEPRVRARVAERLTEAFSRAGLDPEPARALLDVDLPDEPLPEAAEGEETGVPAPEPVMAGGARGSGRNVLAIVDGYSGGLRPPHLRALARAASLCVAFDLDLVVVGFPTDDAEALVDATTAETSIGEGARHAAELLATERMRLVPWQRDRPVDWDEIGTPVATTPNPDTSRAVADLAQVPRPVCLLVGLGRQGLPKGLLETAGYHYELTGRNVSLETATAMGILAERLRVLGTVQVR